MTSSRWWFKVLAVHRRSICPAREIYLDRPASGVDPVGELFWWDSSDRLTFSLSPIEAADYPAMCRRIADELGLTPDGEIVVGPDQMFWDFRRGNQLVGLDWDIWMDLMVVAKSEVSEPLVRDIAAWLATGHVDPASSMKPDRSHFVRRRRTTNVG